MGRTIAEKILEQHLVSGEVTPKTIVRARVDRVLINDVSGPLAFQQMSAMGAEHVAVPDAVVLVCDHFAPAPHLAAARALQTMRAFAREQGIAHFYDVGQGGIEHTLLPEEGLVAPGNLIIGGDSHTCTYGAFDAFGAGYGSTDIAAAMALGDLWFLVPESARFDFTGKRRPFVTGKDVILGILADIGVDGATYQAMEFGGDGLADFNVDERMAICNMAVEAGAKTGFVIPDAVTRAWVDERFGSDVGLVLPDSDAAYVSVRTFDLAQIPPLIARPHSPGNVVPLTEVLGRHIDQVYIGNCANGTITDLRQAASVLRGRCVARGTRAIAVPATQRVYRQALHEGLLDILAEAGVAVSTPTCGACFGGHMGLLDENEVAVTTTNRNFHGRMGHANASVYLANAYIAAAAAVAGELVDPAQVLSAPLVGVQQERRI